MRKMKKLLKAAGFILVLAVAFTSVIACSGKQNDPAPPYDYTKPTVKPDTDADVTLDGKFDDNIWAGNRWLTIDKNVAGETGKVRMTTAFGEKGLYFAYDVDDSVSVKNAVTRDSYNNSCIEMYLTVNVDKIETVFQYEIDLMPTGGYSVKKNASSISGDTWTGYEVKDHHPTLAATTKNGNVNDETCNGYTLEYFMPYEYLLLDGAPQSVSVNPCLISSYGNEATAGRNWCPIASYDLLAYDYVNASMHYRFDVNGLIGYDYTVSANGGAVVETNGKENIIDNRSAKFEIKADAGKRVKTLTVNGEDKLGAIVIENGKPILDLTGIKENAAIVAEFEAIPEETATIGGTLHNTTVYEDADLTVRLFDGTNVYDAAYDAATGAFSATVPQGENYKLIVARVSDGVTVKEEKIALLSDVTDKVLSTITNVSVLGADGVTMNAPLSGDGLTSIASGLNLGENFTLEYFLGLTDHLFPAASENANNDTHYAVLRAVLYNGSEQAFYTGLEMRGQKDLAMWGDNPAVSFSFESNQPKYSGVIDYARANNGITFVVDRQGSVVTAYAKTSSDSLVKLLEGEVSGDITGISFYVSRAVRTGSPRTELVTENNLGIIKNVSAVINPDRKAESANGIYINEAEELGLNGARFTFTNKEDSSVVYSGIVANGRLAVANVKPGTYSVKAELIPGTTSTGADFTVKDGAFVRYEAFDMFRSIGNIRNSSAAAFGENNSLTVPAGVANHGTGVKIDPITGNVFVGTKIKFTKDELATMLASGNDSGLGIAMFTSEDDTYTGIQFWANDGILKLRTMQNWKGGAFIDLCTVTDGNFTLSTNDEGWKAVANAIVGDGVYLVQQKAADNKLTYYFYNSAKDTLLKKYETGFAYADSDTIYAIGTYRWNTGFAYTVSDYRVADSLGAAIGKENIAPRVQGTNGSVTFDKTSYEIGDTVTITLKPNAGFDVLESLLVNGVERASEVNAGEYSFTLYDARVEVEVRYNNHLDARITITDGAALGLNGVKFTLTNKADENIVYEVTVENGALAIDNAKVGTYSVKAALIPGTTSSGDDIVINAANITYNANGMFRGAGKIKSATSQFGENNSISMPEGAKWDTAVKIDAISGDVYVGTKIKFTNDEMVAVINHGNGSALGIAMFTSTGDTYTGLRFIVDGGALKMQSMQDWDSGAFVTLGNVTNGKFTVIATDEGWIKVANALVGDGIYLVQQKATDNTLTYYFYNAAKNTLLKKFDTNYAYATGNGLYAVGTYSWNESFAAYTVADFRVTKSLSEMLGNADVTPVAEGTNGSVTFDKTSYKIGDTVTITLNPNAGYDVLESLLVNGVERASEVNEGEYSFTLYDARVEVEVRFNDHLDARITITDGAALGLNGVKFTLTNKADENVVYEVTVNDGMIAIDNAKLGTYSVKAVLIPGTTTSGEDIAINAANLTYDASGLIFGGVTKTCDVQFGENNSLKLGENASSLTPHIGAKVDNITGEFYVGNLFKFTEEEVTNMKKSNGAVGLALYTGDNEYFGLNIVTNGNTLNLRVLGDWGKQYGAGICDFSSGSYADDSKGLGAALTGDGIYGVLHRAADGKITLYLYNAAKTELLYMAETTSVKTKDVYAIAAGYWDNKTATRFDCEISDILVAKSLGAVIGHEGNVTITKNETNGTVTLDKESYKIGDTATLTLTAAADYPILSSLKINGAECASGVTEADGVKTYSFGVYNVENTIEVTFTDKLNANITITDADKLGLNGVKFTLTNKANSSVVYEVTAANGALAIENAQLGTYSVKAVLIPGTTTTGADIAINAASLTYNADTMFLSPAKVKKNTVQFGENVSIGVANGTDDRWGTGAKIDEISGDLFVGTKIKLTNDEMVAMINSAGTGESGFGIALFDSSGSDMYTGIQLQIQNQQLKLRSLKNTSGSFTGITTLGNVVDGEFNVTTTEEDWKAVAEAMVGDGVYLVQQRGADGKITYYFYNSAKNQLLKEYSIDGIYSSSSKIYAIGTYRWNTGFAYTVTDFRVATSLEGVGVTAA